MKKFSLLLAVLSLSTLAHSQFYVRAGYCANYYSMKNYNAMIDRYNETRPWLTDQLDHINLMHGIDVGFGGMGGSNGYEFYFRSSKAEVTASGSPSGGPVQTRYLKARNNYYGFEMHRRVGGSPVALFLAGELSGFRTFTKVDEAEYTLTDKKTTFGVTAGTKIILGKGKLKPMLEIYYSLPFGKESHANAWETLDQSNFSSEPVENFKSRASHFGVSLSLAFGNIEYM